MKVLHGSVEQPEYLAVFFEPILGGLDASAIASNFGVPPRSLPTESAKKLNYRFLRITLGFHRNIG